MLSDDLDQAAVCCATVDRMNPDGHHFARARLYRIRNAIRVELGALQWHPNPPPHLVPELLTGDIAAVCEQEKLRDVTFTRDRLDHFLLDRNRLHSQFDADRCYDALVKQLNQPRNPSRMEGPVCWSPNIWVSAPALAVAALGAESQIHASNSTIFAMNAASAMRRPKSAIK